jgi:glycosyltransferase involved in cell wall biosynthesis
MAQPAALKQGLARLGRRVCWSNSLDACAPFVNTAAPPRLSLVIPAWNEAACLPRLLDSVDAARAACPAQVEVIVADNASTDGTAELAQMRGCVVASVEKRCIAAARNGGAALARGEWLAFVDADSSLHPQVFNALLQAAENPRTLGGASRVTMERWSLGIALAFASMLPLVWLTGFDSGLVFWRRADFEAIGGYDETRMIAEDVDMLIRLRRLGRPRGQKLVRLRGVKTITSTRKFDRHGDWHWFAQMPRIGWRLLRNPRSLSEFARRYWYEGR